jgi:hypothetical protein
VNEIASAPGFLRGYAKKRRRSPAWLVEKIENWIVRLRGSDRPEDLGGVKRQTVVFRGQTYRAYAVDLTDSDRLVFGVDRDRTPAVVILDRVCNHKAAYGRD